MIRLLAWQHDYISVLQNMEKVSIVIIVLFHYMHAILVVLRTISKTRELWQRRKLPKLPSQKKSMLLLYHTDI